MDVFYLADAKGARIETPQRLKALRAKLLKAASEPEAEKAAVCKLSPALASEGDQA